MAIKNSWSAGEVLLAADLTDTVVDKVSKAPSSSQTITSGTATTKPLIIKAAAGQTANLLEFQNSGGTAIAAIAADGQYFGGQARNLLYNGSMQVAQRGTSTTGITAAGYYTADRWLQQISSAGTWTQTVENDAPTGSGLRKSLKVLCTTADAAPSAGDYHIVQQSLEGQDVQRVAKGTASAQQLTLSFWVKSNVTGTYVAELEDNDNSRRVSASYSISASATWEKKTITFPADTTGALDNDNAASLAALFRLGAGSNFTGGSPLQTTWGTATNTRATGQTNVAAATNNYWQVTGVQLEVGPVATSFEFKPYGRELMECQRYYRRVTPGVGYGSYGIGQAYTTTAAEVPIIMGQHMRAAVTAIDTSATASHYVLGNSGMGAISLSAVPTLTSGRATPTAAILTCTVASGLVAGNATQMIADASGNGYIGFSAEL